MEQTYKAGLALKINQFSNSLSCRGDQFRENVAVRLVMKHCISPGNLISSS